MTIGPAPMMRIDEMSVLLGICLAFCAQKKGALLRVLRPAQRAASPRAGAL
jgi:hypothetical protein